MSSAIGKIRITLEIYGNIYSAELEGCDYTADKLKDAFSRLLVQATYPPSVIESAEEDGHWEWKTDEGV